MTYPGTLFTSKATTFRVWAPEKQTMDLHLTSPYTKVIAMEKDQEGYFTATIPDLPEGARYLYSPDGKGTFPDPASHFQPDGVHEASAVVDHGSFAWQDQSWKGVRLKDLVLYELHVGTFTPEGTFEAMIPRLDALAETGITAIELMPVSQFPGNRNWGYDGVYPYAVQHSYGGPEGLKKLVDAAHRRGIAVIMDVVFNHLGPEGNYLSRFGPYFTSNYCTPWGDAINFDSDYADGVREYFTGVMLHLYENYHLDGLRVDAVHAIYDNGAVPWWQLVEEVLTDARLRVGRAFHLIAESGLNSPRIVRRSDAGGYGFDAQWLDDFHHTLYVLLDEAGRDRYADYGSLRQLAKAYTDGFVLSGEYVGFYKRKFGASSVGLPGETFVVFNQNHDQIGNRVGGERLSMLVDFEKQKLAAAAMLLSPYLPMFFMGEEYGEDSPFFYFVSHSEEDLIRMVVEGRKKEFENFKWDTDPLNPQEPSTFEKSKIHWEKRTTGRYATMLEWNKTLLKMRRELQSLSNFNKNNVRADVQVRGLLLRRQSDNQREITLCFFNFSDQPAAFRVSENMAGFERILDSADPHWAEPVASPEGGSVPGAADGPVVAPWSVVVYHSRS